MNKYVKQITGMLSFVTLAQKVIWVDKLCRHANYYDISVIITNLSPKYDITDWNEKITNFEKSYDFLWKSSSDG